MEDLAFTPYAKWDSAGITITSTLLRRGAGEVVELLDTDGVVLRGLDDSRLSFLDVADVTVASDGDVLVLESSTATIHRIGDRVRSLGASGDGPGEFRRPTRILEYGTDSVWVWDASHRRLTLFDSVTQPPEVLSLHPDGLPASVSTIAGAPTGFLPDGSIVMQASRRPETDGRARQAVIFSRFSPGEQEGDSLFTVSGDEVWVEYDGEENLRSRMVYPSPFGARTSFATAADGSLILADGASGEVAVHDTRSGALIRLYRFRRSRKVVDGSVIEADQRALEAAGVDAAIREQVASRAETVAAGGEFPIFGELIVGVRGELWLSGYVNLPGFSSEWWVIDREGRLIRRVQFPAGVRLLHVAPDSLIGVQRTAKGDYSIRIFERPSE